MSTVVSLPEKRHDPGQEQPPEKRAKLTTMESKYAEEAKSGEGSSAHTRRVTKFVCEICRTNGHKCWDCPKRSQGMGWGCTYYYGPCKKKDDDPREHWSIEMVKDCVVCGKMGNHWADECPFRSDGDDDDDFGLRWVLENDTVEAEHALGTERKSTFESGSHNNVNIVSQSRNTKSSSSKVCQHLNNEGTSNASQEDNMINAAVKLGSDIHENEHAHTSEQYDDDDDDDDEISNHEEIGENAVENLSSFGQAYYQRHKPGFAAHCQHHGDSVTGARSGLHFGNSAASLKG
ncbi:hypothetical protein ACS0TY_002247 [Phlomoides rotata]